MKINLGAGPYWHKDGWHVLDHKLSKPEPGKVNGDISKINLPSNSCDVAFSSHVIEHIPHLKIQKVFTEINRVLKKDGVLRILVPDMEKFAKAYAIKDKSFFKIAKKENHSLRQDLGYGGMLANIIVAPGQDTVLMDRELKSFVGGYAHIYGYDFKMLQIILKKTGYYQIKKKNFCQSKIKDLREPLHVMGKPARYYNLNNEYYKKKNLIHKYSKGGYTVNFKITGFDKLPHTSLIIEAKKKTHIKVTKKNNLNNFDNYNFYGYSLLEDKKFKRKFNLLSKVSKKLKDPYFNKKLQKLLKVKSK